MAVNVQKKLKKWLQNLKIYYIITLMKCMLRKQIFVLLEEIKMTKKILSVVTTAAVIGSMACASVVNTSAFSGEIKFEVSENLGNANKVFYAHIWNGLPGGQGLYQWQTANEKMTWSKGESVATYQVPEGDWNLIIISGDSGFQTYDSVFNANCIGDTCYMMDEKYENPVDSKKTANGLGWRNNSDCGPHKVVSSIGNVIGTAFLPGETDQTLYDNFVKAYDVNNETNADAGIFNWNDDGLAATGKDWETIKKEVADKLGVQVNSSTSSSDNNSSSSSNNSSSNNSSSNSSASSNSSSSNSSSSSSSSTGTTTTGDSTPLVALFATLTAALGVAFFARKKSVK